MPRTAEPIKDRIERGVLVDPVSECWNWLGAKNAGGYGRIAIPTGKMGGATAFTHRVAYEAYVGPISDGLVLDHLCRNPSCCNPDHLEPVTQKVNMHRGDGDWAVNAAKTHCKFNHEFTPENTRIIPRGRRCIACEKRRARESKARAKANA